MLARVGLGSRRACEELIAAGRVTVNGEPAELGRRVDVDHDLVALDGVPLPVLPGLVHYLLHKPAGVVTTAHDPFDRPTVLELVPDAPRVFPVGRLDADSEGLLVLTNDGELAQRLTHPSFGVEKEYLVEVDGVPSAGDLRRLRLGVDLDDGKTAPATVGVVAPGVIRIVIHEGPQPPDPPHVRRRRAIPCAVWCAPASARVTDPHLKPGTWRALEAPEVRALGRAAAQPRTRVWRHPARPQARDGPGQRVDPPGGRSGPG